MSEERYESARRSPQRVVQLEIPRSELSEALLGVQAPSCRLVFVHMLPVGEPARLTAVLPHGLTLESSADSGSEYAQLLVPWSQVAYITTDAPEPAGTPQA